MKTMLVTGSWSSYSKYEQTIKNLGFNVIFLQNEKDEIPKVGYQAEYIICNGLFLYHNIEKFSKLKYIQLTSAGYDRVPMEYIIENKIKINNARGVYSIPIAEFVLGNILAIYKKNGFFSGNQKECIWEKNREVKELFGKRVLIIGAGNIGTECAKRFKAFGNQVIGLDLYPQKNEFYDDILSIYYLNKELEKSDVVVITLPLTKETYHLINREALKCMKKEFVLVNVSRGGIIDEDALYEVLKENKNSVAILDVFENEPLPKDSPLWKLDNLVVRPHNSFVGEGNMERLSEIILKNLEE